MRCEACGAAENRDAKRWLEAHERWVYDDATRVQRLKRLICLCTDCHTVTHYGYAQVRGLESKAFAHLVKVTGMSHTEARSHIRYAFNVWEARSARSWTLDLSMLTDAGVTLQRPPRAGERRGSPQRRSPRNAAPRGPLPPMRARSWRGLPSSAASRCPPNLLTYGRMNLRRPVRRSCPALGRGGAFAAAADPSTRSLTWCHDAGPDAERSSCRAAAANRLWARIAHCTTSQLLHGCTAMRSP